MQEKCLTPEKIQEYLDNTLPHQERQEIAAHLKNCPDCNSQAQAYARLFSAATSSAKKQIQNAYSRGSVEAVMHRIPGTKATDHFFKSGKPVPAKFHFKLNWLWIPTMALVILLIIFSRTKSVPDSALPGLPVPQFSLLDNSVEVLIGEPPPHARAIIKPDTEVKLDSKTMILVNVAAHKFKFTPNSIFAINNNEVELKSGDAEFSMIGNHENFKVKTHLVSVVPLGTRFGVSVKSWGVKIAVQKGRVALESFTGNHRNLETSQTLYVGTDGNFSADIPQQPAHTSPDSSSQQSPVTPQPDGTTDSPTKLIDSF